MTLQDNPWYINWSSTDGPPQFIAIQSSDWLVVEIYNNRIHKIFMATDNTSDISENDIIVAFELKNNSNPLAIYLEYQSKFLFGRRPSIS